MQIEGLPITNTMETKERRKEWVEDIGSKLLMDNHQIHKGEVPDSIFTSGYECMFLPPWSPELDPIELIKVRMEDFGYKPADLANEYGDKGTISKVLNYKQPLSLTMIRKFSKMLRLPSDALTKEYLTT